MTTVTEIPLAVPHLGGNEARYVNQCVETNMVSSVGPFVDRFEREFAAFVGAKNAVACVSGTAALHVALRVAGAESGGVVPVPDLTFVASANAIRYCGAAPLLVDSEPRTWNMDTERLHAEIVRRARIGLRLPDVIEIVHILGHPAEIEPLLDLRTRYGIRIVEDAAEALGAAYRSGLLAGHQVGTIGDFGCFSFNGNKVMTTGGGGMITTNDADLAARARHLTTQAKRPGRGYIHDDVGYNYRLSNVAAAVGVAQLEQLPAFLAAKRRIAARYAEALEDLPVTLPPAAAWAEPSWWLYSVLLHPGEIGPEDLIERLAEERIQARPLWQPLHLQQPYLFTDWLRGELSKFIAQSGVSLPSSVDLSDDEQDRVIDVLHTATTSSATVSTNGHRG